MPRTGWLAAGATIAALAAAGDHRVLVALVAAAGLMLAGALWLPPERRIAVLAVALGILSVALRAGLGTNGPSLTGSPVGSGPWTVVVEIGRLSARGSSGRDRPNGRRWPDAGSGWPPPCRAIRRSSPATACPSRVVRGNAAR